MKKPKRSSVWFVASLVGYIVMVISMLGCAIYAAWHEWQAISSLVR